MKKETLVNKKMSIGLKSCSLMLYREVFVSLCKVLGQKYYHIGQNTIKSKNSTIKQNRGLVSLLVWWVDGLSFKCEFVPSLSLAAQELMYHLGLF